VLLEVFINACHDSLIEAISQHICAQVIIQLVI
jgi:hypothetical protein